LSPLLKRFSMSSRATALVVHYDDILFRLHFMPDSHDATSPHVAFTASRLLLSATGRHGHIEASAEHALSPL
jgi:hypothetical protein